MDCFWEIKMIKAWLFNLIYVKTVRSKNAHNHACILKPKPSIFLLPSLITFNCVLSSLKTRPLPSVNCILPDTSSVVQHRRRARLTRDVDDIVMISETIESRSAAFSVCSHFFKVKPIAHVERSVKGAAGGDTVNAVARWAPE